MSKIRKSEITVGRQVAYKRGNDFSLASILEVKTRIKIDDEGEERWVTPESLHSLERLKPNKKGMNYSAALQRAMPASGPSITPNAVQGMLEGLGIPSGIATVLTIIIFLIGGISYFCFGLGQSNEVASEPTATPTTIPAPATATSLPVPTSNANPDDPGYDLYFTTPIYPDRPENRPERVPIKEALIAAINETEQTLDIAIYELNLPKVGEAILAAQDRGVAVRLVTDSDEIEELEVLIELNEAGIPMVEDDRSAIMHNKFVIFDRKAVWTGSWNFTPNGTYRNNNHGILIRSPELAAVYQEEFEELFSGEFGPRSPSQPTSIVQVGNSSIEACFAPEDECGNRLIDLLDGAQQSIHVMAFSFTHDGMSNVIRKRAKAGVTVRALFEQRGASTKYSEFNRFKRAKLDALIDGNPYTMHHKALVIDGQQTVLGSFNFSQNADESNDENLLIIDNADIAAAFLDEFERNYEQALNPPNK